MYKIVIYNVVMFISDVPSNEIHGRNIDKNRVGSMVKCYDLRRKQKPYLNYCHFPNWYGPLFQE